MKNSKITLTKVYSRDCEICEHMSRYDLSVAEGFSVLEYKTVDIDDIVDHSGDPGKLLLYSLIERHAINPDYTVDVPIYLLSDNEGKYIGHLSGEMNIKDLRNGIKRLIEGGT